MICLRCGHYTHPDREMDRAQGSERCSCDCHPWRIFFCAARDCPGQPYSASERPHLGCSR